jgi:hypothetical protein
MDIAPMMEQLVALERQVSAAAAAANPRDEMRVYEWRPSGFPELPAIWNWIDDGSVEIPDTARVDDLIVITATIGVRPSDVGESLGRLVRLTDHFRAVVDPALKTNQPLAGTAKRARRIVTRTSIDDFNDVPVMCMDMLIRVELPQIIGG